MHPSTGRNIGAFAAPLMVALMVAAAPPAHALGGGGNQPTKPCPEGQVRNGSGKCVKAQTNAVPDDIFAENAYGLAKAGRYQEALTMLDLMVDPETPKALNYRGYATRKLGRLDEGIGYYEQAVAKDPNYVLVREYLGEAYMLKGRPDLARQELAQVERLCGNRECESYEDLAAAIGGHPED